MKTEMNILLLVRGEDRGRPGNKEWGRALQEVGKERTGVSL